MVAMLDMKFAALHPRSCRLKEVVVANEKLNRRLARKVYQDDGHRCLGVSAIMVELSAPG